MSEYIVNVGYAADEYVEWFGKEAETLFGHPICEEIVRCRDCAYLVESSNPMSRTGWWCIENDTPRSLDGFCNYAERRDA